MFAHQAAARSFVVSVALAIVVSGTMAVCQAEDPTASLTIVQKVNFVVGIDYDQGDILSVKATTTVTVPASHPASETFYLYLKMWDDATPSGIVIDTSDFRTVSPGNYSTFDLEDFVLASGPSWYYGWAKVEYFENLQWHTAAYQDFYFQD